MRTKFLLKKLKEDEKSLLQQLESFNDDGKEIQFQPVMPESELDIFGFVAVDGVLPWHLSLCLLSELADFRAGATLRLEVVRTQPGLSDSWLGRIVVTVVAAEEDGPEREIPFQRKMKDGKVLLRFEAGLGVHRVSVRLYGQHIQSSPFLLPIRADPEKILAEVGLCFFGQSQPEPAGEAADDVKRQPESFPAESSDTSSSSTTSAASSRCEESPGQTEEGEEKSQNFTPGQIVLVNRGGVGLKAVFQKIMKPLGHYLVQFIEEGEFDLISPSEVSYVVEEEESPLPQQETPKVIGATTDGDGEDVKETGKPWKVQERCCARWETDGVWYNAEIKECLPGGRYHVVFTDYGNEDYVFETGLVKSSLELQDLDLIDEFVTQYCGEEGEEGEGDGREDNDGGESRGEGEGVVKQEDFSTGKGSSSSSLASSEVREKTAAQPSLPSGPQCSLCLKDARRAKELICDGSIVCWGCAVQVDLQYRHFIFYFNFNSFIIGPVPVLQS